VLIVRRSLLVGHRVPAGGVGSGAGLTACGRSAARAGPECAARCCLRCG
jgi:hypothetical protein